MKKGTQNLIITLSILVVMGLVIGLIIFISGFGSVSGETPVIETNELSLEDIDITKEENIPVETIAPSVTRPRTTVKTRSTPKATTVPEIETPPADTSVTQVVATLAPVDTLSSSQRAIMEEKNIDVRQTTATEQTTPPPDARPDVKTTYIDGVRYRWHDIFGWIESNGDGSTGYVNIEPSGEKYEGGWG